MATSAGHTIISKGKNAKNPINISRFYTSVDKGSARPAFCHERRVVGLREDVASMQKALDMGRVSGERRMTYEIQLEKKAARLKAVEANVENAKSVIAEDPDAWAKERKRLAQIIRDGTPTRKDERNRCVNPHAVLKSEKNGLGRARRDYKIISKAMGEESNTSFLQKDK